MITILGDFLFAIVAVMTVHVACGAPLGEFTMHKKLSIIIIKAEHFMLMFLLLRWNKSGLYKDMSKVF